MSHFIRDGGVVPSPEPHVDEGARPLDDIPSTANAVEIGSEGRYVGLRLGDASGIACIAGGTDIVADRTRNHASANVIVCGLRVPRSP